MVVYSRHLKEMSRKKSNVSLLRRMQFLSISFTSNTWSQCPLNLSATMALLLTSHEDSLSTPILHFHSCLLTDRLRGDFVIQKKRSWLQFPVKHGKSCLSMGWGWIEWNNCVNLNNNRIIFFLHLLTFVQVSPYTLQQSQQQWSLFTLLDYFNQSLQKNQRKTDVNSIFSQHSSPIDFFWAKLYLNHFLIIDYIPLTMWRKQGMLGPTIIE